MILTCPACDTRYQADEANFPPAGRKVRCAKCGHVWHQQGSAPAPEPDVAALAPERRSPNRPCRAPAPLRQERCLSPNASPWRWGPWRRWRRAGFALIAVVLVIGYAAVKYRQESR